MPYLKIMTSNLVEEQPRRELLKASSKLVASELGKPEKYMMVSMDTSPGMLFAGTDEPCAFLELRGIGLPASTTGKLSKLLCQLVESHLAVGKDRIYINFADVPANLWGWNGDTF